MEDPVDPHPEEVDRVLARYYGVKPPFMCPHDWGKHACFLTPGHRARHLCACGERAERD